MTSVGSVSVTVTPDARRFPEKLRAQLKSLGDIPVKIRPDEGSVAKTKAQLEASLKNIKSNVDLDTAKARAEAAALKKSFDNVGQSKGVDEQQRKIGNLVTAITALGPAIVPVGAAVVAAGASVGALGVTGLLAFGGIKKEMAAGTVTGKAYSAGLSTLKGDLATLQRTAAGGVLTGFESSIKSIQPLIPELNADTAQLSGKLGDIVSHVMPGLVSLFHTANPLLLDFADDIDRGAVAFQHWSTSSDGASKFVAYAQAELPKVEHAVGSLATTVGHLVQGFGPLGGVSLTAIGTLSKAINTLPIPVLKVAIPAIAGTVLAIKGFEVAALVAPKIALLTGSLQGMAYANAIAGTSSLSLLATLGKIAPVAVVATAGIYGAVQVAQDKLGPAAGRAGEIADEVLKLIANRTHQTTDEIKAGVSGTDAQFQAYLGTLGKVDKTSKTYLDSLHDKLGKVAKSTSDFGYASGTLAGSQVKAGIVIDGVTVSINKQTTAAGLLKNAFDRLNGTALSVEQTENTFLDTLGGLKKATDAGTSSISQNSAKGRVNREVLVQAITAANDAAQATADQTAKTKGLSAGLDAGRVSLVNHEAAIRRAAAAAGLDKGEVDKLIASLGRVPKNVVSAISIRDKASAQIATIKANIAALKSHQIDITTYVHNVILPTVNQGGPDETVHKPHAAGGGVDDGWFTVGEGSANTWELGHKQGTNVQIFSNAQSKKMAPGGPYGPMPGYAGGTLNGIQYTTDTALRNAQARAAASTTKSDKALVVRFDRTDLTRFEKALKGGAQGIAAAMRSFNADLKSAGTGVAGLGGLESRLAGLATRRASVNARLTSASGTLADLRQQSAQEQATVSDRVLGEFNVAGAGNGSIAGILANLTQNRDAAGKFAGNLGTLKSIGLDPKLLAQLGEAGVSGGGVNASALAGASKAQIAQINALFKQTGTFAATAGKTVAGAEFGPAISAWTRQVNALTAQSHQLTKQIDHLGDVISSRVGHALDAALDRAVKKQAALALAAKRAH